MEFRAEKDVPRPSLLAVAALMTGLAVAHSFEIGSFAPGGALLAGAFALGAAARHRPAVRLAAILTAFFALGLALLVPHQRAVRDARMVLAQFETIPAGPIFLRGEVEGDPQLTASRLRVRVAPGAQIAFSDTTARFPLSVYVWMTPPEGGVLPDLAPGDRLEAVGSLQFVADDPIPGDSDAWAIQQSIGLVFRARTWTTEAPSQRTLWSRARLASRRLAERIVDTELAHLSPESGALLAATTIGRTEKLSSEQRVAFRRSGLVHIFSVSGLHAALMAGILTWIATAMGFGPRLRAAFVLAGLGFFCLVTGLHASALRAACLVAIFLLRPLMRREFDSLGALATIALLFLLVRPLFLWQTDFQLSFLCALVLVLVAPGAVAIEETLGRRWKAHWRLGFLIRALQTLFISVCIQLALAPVLAGFQGEVSLVAPLSNVLVLPLVTLAMGAGFAAVALEAVFPGVGALLFAALDPVLRLIDWATASLAALPFASLTSAGPWPLALAGLYYAVLLSGRWIRFRPRFSELDGAPSGALCACAALAIAVWVPVLRPQPELLRATFLDVGQGDAILLQTRDGATALVDTGPDRKGALVGDLQRRGVRHLDMLVLTHADADHIGEAAAVIDAFPPRTVLVGGSLAATETFQSLAGTIRQHASNVITVRRGATFDLSPAVQVHVLHPTDEFVAEGIERNDASVVLRIDTGAIGILLTGDAESAAEADMVAALGRTELASMVLKAGHHGAATSTSTPFLEAVSPSIAILSCGRGNRYGHPRAETLTRLGIANVSAWRTDIDGTIVVGTNGSDITINSERRRESRGP